MENVSPYKRRVSGSKMANMGVHPAEIIMTLNGQNKTVYSGYFDSGEKRVRVNVNGAYKEIDDIRNLLIKGHEQDQIRLSGCGSCYEGLRETGTGRFVI